MRIFNVVEEPMEKERLCEKDTRILLLKLITYDLLWQTKRAKRLAIASSKPLVLEEDTVHLRNSWQNFPPIYMVVEHEKHAFGSLTNHCYR